MDRSLNNLYSKVYKREEFEPKKTLTNVYAENVSLYTHDPNTNTYPPLGSVTDADFNKIKRRININTNNNFDVLSDLVKNSGFDSQHKWLTLFFEEYDIDYTALQKLNKNKSSAKDLTNVLTGPYGTFKISDIVLPIIKNILPTSNDNIITQFYNRLFIRTFADRNVGVGKGEFLLSLFTECKKGDVGDLQLPNNNGVELKVGKARIVSYRDGGFRPTTDLLNRLANNPNLNETDLTSINDQIPYKSFDNNSVKAFFQNDDKSVEKRLQLFGSLMLNGYAKHSQGFKYIVLVKQAGAMVKKVPVMQPGTYSDSNFIDTTSLQNIINATKNNIVKFQYDLNGVYIYHPSSTGGAKFDTAI